MGSAPLLAGLAELGDFVGVDILNPLASDWMILDASSGAPVIVPDTVARFEYRGEARISDYPVEQGAFSSYNKVATPFDIRMLMVCAGANFVQTAVSALGLSLGSQPMQRADFLATLDYMLATTDLFDLVTPDKHYTNVSLVHYDYKKETRNGAVMLLVEGWFREVRVTGAATYSSGSALVQSDSPSAASPVGLGTVQTTNYGAPAIVGFVQ